MPFLEQLLNRERLPYPLQQIGIGGFSLFARVNDRLTLKADNPTSYVEDGSPLNDHRVKKPELLTISGSIGDVYQTPNTLVDRVQSLDNNLGQITQYFPRLTPSQAINFTKVSSNAVSQINKLENLINAGAQANSLLGNIDNLSKPLGEQFLDAMENIHYGSQLVSIQMPYRIYDSMSIKSVIIERSNTSDGVTFTIEAERFRIADLNFVAVDRVSTRGGGTAERAGANPAESLGGQADTIKDKGAQEGRAVSSDEVRSSGLSDIAGVFGD